jgi:hypothetical protein
MADGVVVSEGEGSKSLEKAVPSQADIVQNAKVTELSHYATRGGALIGGSSAILSGVVGTGMIMAVRYIAKVNDWPSNVADWALSAVGIFVAALSSFGTVMAKRLAWRFASKAWETERQSARTECYRVLMEIDQDIATASTHEVRANWRAVRVEWENRLTSYTSANFPNRPWPGPGT